MKLKPVNEQVVVIMGASSGIGRDTALLLARSGAKVVLSARSQEALDSLVEQIRSNGGEATALAAEVSEFDQVKKVAEHAVETYGWIDTWVHLAAVSMWATFENTTPEEFRRIVDVNLSGQAFGAMAALPIIKQQGQGALIHVGSVESKRPLPLQSAYAASKKGMEGFLDSLRMELQDQKAPVSVTAIYPASVNTPLFDKALTKLGVRPAPVPPVYEPEIVAEAILYAAEHPVREIFVGSASNISSILNRISPRLADAVMLKLGQMQYSDVPKSEFAAHNLFKHLDGFDTVKGDYEPAKPTSVATWLQTHPAASLGIGAAIGFAAILVPVMAFRARMVKVKQKRNSLWCKFVRLSPLRFL